MEGLLCSKSLPPGFRFYPTDEELFMYYLKRKVSGKSVSPGMIAEVDVYQYAPWELPPMASLKTRDLNWYFFCPRGKKYPNGGRANRATKLGYWKSTGNDRTMMYNSRPVGKIKTLIFHRGKAPKGERTDWVMHEYRLEDKVLTEKGVPQESFVICKIYEKSGLGPRNGENYGARFVEEEWDSDCDDDDNVRERDLEVVPVGMVHGCVGNCPDGSSSALTTAVGTPNAAAPVEFPAAAAAPPPIADVINPDISTSFVDTSFIPAALGTQHVTPAALGIQHVTRTQHATPAAVGSACAFTSSLPSSSTAACDMDEIEMQRLLSYLVEDDCTDIFSGLGDLDFPAGQYDLGLSDHLSMDDLK